MAIFNPLWKESCEVKGVVANVRVDKELATGICVCCLLNHVCQIVMGLFIVPMNAIQSVGLNEKTEEIRDIVDNLFISQDPLIH